MTRPAAPRVRVEHADCLDAMRAMAARGEVVQAIVTDPPYHLTAVSRRGGPRRNDPETPFGRARLGERGFMGRTWDGGDIAFQVETWRLAFALLPPGGHLLAFGGTRTYHRLACAIEDAGFEIRDCIRSEQGRETWPGWVYGTGFPKNHDFAADREASKAAGKRVPLPEFADGPFAEGFGTALKPAWEPIVMARKPLAGTVAQTVLAHGTGAINVGACRVGTTRGVPASLSKCRTRTVYGGGFRASERDLDPNVGRWPANLVHDGSDEVLAAFAAFGERPSRHDGVSDFAYSPSGRRVFGADLRVRPTFGYGDTGDASRFFYSAKAGKRDRRGSEHPTVKPVALMSWLCRLVCPPGGTVLDPFAGSGTTLEAAMLEGFHAIGIEQDAGHVRDSLRRVAEVEAEMAEAAA